MNAAPTDLGCPLLNTQITLEIMMVRSGSSFTFRMSLHRANFAEKEGMLLYVKAVMEDYCSAMKLLKRLTHCI